MKKNMFESVGQNPNVIEHKRQVANGGIPQLSREEVLALVPRRERKDFKLPRDFDQIKWDTIEFLSWKHLSGHRAYLLENESGKPRLWVFECGIRSTSKHPSMCGLCNSIKKGSGVELFTHRSDDKTRVIGFYFCSDLDCVDCVEKTNPNSMRETISPEKKRERMLENLHGVLTAIDQINVKEGRRS